MIACVYLVVVGLMGWVFVIVIIMGIVYLDNSSWIYAVFVLSLLLVNYVN